MGSRPYIERGRAVRAAHGELRQELVAHHRAWDRDETRRVVDLVRDLARAVAERTK